MSALPNGAGVVVPEIGVGVAPSTSRQPLSFVVGSGDPETSAVEAAENVKHVCPANLGRKNNVARMPLPEGPSGGGACEELQPTRTEFSVSVAG
jgi:hypothetical protein